MSQGVNDLYCACPGLALIEAHSQAVNFNGCCREHPKGWSDRDLSGFDMKINLEVRMFSDLCL